MEASITPPLTGINLIGNLSYIIASASILLCRHVSSSFINSGTVQGARYHLQGTEKQGVPLKPSAVQLQTIISLNYSAGAPQFDITLRT